MVHRSRLKRGRADREPDLNGAGVMETGLGPRI